MTTITEVVRKLADQIVEGGVRLSAKPDTPVALVASALSVPMENIEAENSEELVASVESHFKVHQPNPFTASFESDELVLGDEKELSLEAVLKSYTPIAQGIVETVRDRVIPTVNAIYEKAFTETNDNIVSGGIKLDIVTDGSENPIWANPAILEFVNANALGDVNQTSIDELTFPSLPADALKDVLNNTHGEIQELVLNYLGEDVDAAMQTVYNRAFRAGTDVLSNGPEELYPLLGMLIATHLRSNPPEGMSGVEDVGIYRAHIDRLINAFGAQMKRHIETGALFVKTDRLVIKFPEPRSEYKEGSKIIVNGLLWDSYLESGGSVDAVYGAFVSSTRPTKVATILEDKAELERAWVRYVAAAQSAQKDDFERVFVGALHRTIYSQAEELGLSVDSKGIEHMYKRETSIDPDCAYHFARRAVVNSLFADGDYLSVIEEIDAIAEKLPGIELADAVELGIIDWLVKWALDQVSVKHV